MIKWHEIKIARLMGNTTRHNTKCWSIPWVKRGSCYQQMDLVNFLCNAANADCYSSR